MVRKKNLGQQFYPKSLEPKLTKKLANQYHAKGVNYPCLFNLHFFQLSFLKDGDIFQILVGIVHASMTKGSSHF